MIEYQGKQYEKAKQASSSLGSVCDGCAFRYDGDIHCDGKDHYAAFGSCLGVIFIEKKSEQYGIIKLQQPAFYGSGSVLAALSEVADRQFDMTPQRDEAAAKAYKPAHAGYPDVGAVRSSDPDTSVAAAVAVKVMNLQEVILAHLQAVGSAGATGKEIAAAQAKPLNSITPRFAQLRAKGLIEAGGMRDKQIVWRLV